jgi:hypothetical protein
MVCCVICSSSKSWRILSYLKIEEPKGVLILCTFSAPLNCNGSMVFIFSVKKETSVDFDMKKSISRTSFVGKDSAV